MLTGLVIFVYCIGWIIEFNRSYATSEELNGVEYPHNALVAGAVATMWPVMVTVSLGIALASAFTRNK